MHDEFWLTRKSRTHYVEVLSLLSNSLETGLYKKPFIKEACDLEAMPKRKFKIDTLGKEPRKMASSLIQNALVGAILQHVIIEPTVDAGQTSQTGDVFENADTERRCAANSIVKYVNFIMQVAIKSAQTSNSGWIEWGLVSIENATALPATPSNANFGIRSLGDILSHEFRNRCIMTGAIPVSSQIPVVVPFSFKLPDICIKNQLGKYLIFYWGFRSSDAADVATTARCMTTAMYKCYI